MIKTHGLHHISSMVGHGQRNMDFYARVLGQRLVKKTLNYDDKSMYHLYFGNHQASTGLITTFPMNDSNDGEVGSGQVGIANYGIRPESFEFWKNRLKKFNIEVSEDLRFNKKRLSFKDLDGLGIELIETDKGPKNLWEFNGVDQDNAIVGIDSAVIYSAKPEETLKLFTDILGYEVVDSNSDNFLLSINDDLGGSIELAKDPHNRGIMGVGTVHHIAFAVNNDEIYEWKNKLEENGYRPTEVKIRKYFKSLYFRESGGLLIELATKGPGMTVDEDVENLGKNLIIPDHYQNDDHSHLMPLFVREVDELIGYGYRDKYEYDVLEKKHKIMNQIKEIKSKKDISEEDRIEIEKLKAKYLDKGEY